MKLLLLFISTVISVAALAQPSYIEKMKQYQLAHKADLANDLHIDTAKVKFYPLNKDLVIKANVDLLQNEKVFDMITSSGKKKEAVKYAKITFKYLGKEYRLYAYQLIALKNSKEYANNFFIPFKDNGSGKESYKGGRYIDFVTDDIKGAQLEIDFNKAYNPNCAYVTGYNCPIPPAENTLAFAVNAGTKKFEGH